MATICDARSDVQNDLPFLAFLVGALASDLVLRVEGALGIVMDVLTKAGKC